MFETKINTSSTTQFIESNDLYKVLDDFRGKYTHLAIFVDVAVYKVHRNTIDFFPNVKIVQSGEASKDYYKLVEYYKFLIDKHIDKNSIIVGIGGGVLTDIVGFVASTFKRGIELALIPSTILSAVDAAIGGKNGVNFLGYKNMIGNISQPNFIVFDYSLLRTLPEEVFYEGFAEIIKYALISDIEFLSFLEENIGKATEVGSEVFHFILKRCAEIKMEIVSRDPKDENLRKILNFGHTLAHAIETINGIPHGQAVAIGMVFASYVSMKLGNISKEDYQRIIAVLKKYHLPVFIQLDPKRASAPIGQDKKRRGDKIDLIILEKLGKAEILPIPFVTILEWLEKWNLD